MRLLHPRTQLAERGFDVKHVVVVARLWAGTGQRLAGVIGQKEQVGGARRFAARVADGRPAVFGRGVAAIELDTGQVK